MAEPPRSDGARDDRRATGRDVAIVAILAVAFVLGASVLTSFLPPDAQRVVFHSPLLIVVLLVGTGGLLVGIARRPPG